jgi:hypothetical protein
MRWKVKKGTQQSGKGLEKSVGVTIKMDLKTYCVYGLDSTGSEQGPYEYDNNYSNFANCKKTCTSSATISL